MFAKPKRKNMKTILSILAIIALPSVGLLYQINTGAISFGLAFLICLTCGYIAAVGLEKNKEL
jgi:hypothetical protein